MFLPILHDTFRDFRVNAQLSQGGFHRRHHAFFMNHDWATGYDIGFCNNATSPSVILFLVTGEKTVLTARSFSWVKRVWCNIRDINPPKRICTLWHLPCFDLWKEGQCHCLSNLWSERTGPSYILHLLSVPELWQARGCFRKKSENDSIACGSLSNVDFAYLLPRRAREIRMCPETRVPVMLKEGTKRIPRAFFSQILKGADGSTRKQPRRVCTCSINLVFASLPLRSVFDRWTATNRAILVRSELFQLLERSTRGKRSKSTYRLWDASISAYCLIKISCESVGQRWRADYFFLPISLFFFFCSFVSSCKVYSFVVSTNIV